MKNKLIIVLLVILISLFLVERFAENPLVDFQMELIPIEFGPRFKISCSIINRGLKTGEQIEFLLKLPKGLKLLEANNYTFFESMAPLTRKNLQWTIEAIEIGSYEIEGILLTKSGSLGKRIKAQTVCQMIIFLEKMKLTAATDWITPSDIYLTVKVDGTETRIPETGEISMVRGQIVDLNKIVYNDTVIEQPLLEAKVRDKDLLGSESLGSIEERIPLNLDSTWFITDKNKAELLLSSKSTINRVISSSYLF